MTTDPADIRAQWLEVLPLAKGLLPDDCYIAHDNTVGIQSSNFRWVFTDEDWPEWVHAMLKGAGLEWLLNIPEITSVGRRDDGYYHVVFRDSSGIVWYVANDNLELAVLAALRRVLGIGGGE